ncbi:hypothetical protein RI367_005490 [Sorochytrium milnesiophthora]
MDNYFPLLIALVAIEVLLFACHRRRRQRIQEREMLALGGDVDNVYSARSAAWYLPSGWSHNRVQPPSSPDLRPSPTQRQQQCADVQPPRPWWRLWQRQEASSPAITNAAATATVPMEQVLAAGPAIAALDSSSIYAPLPPGVNAVQALDAARAPTPPQPAMLNLQHWSMQIRTRGFVFSGLEPLKIGEFDEQLPRYERQLQPSEPEATPPPASDAISVAELGHPSRRVSAPPAPEPDTLLLAGPPMAAPAQLVIESS